MQKDFIEKMKLQMLQKKGVSIFMQMKLATLLFLAMLYNHQLFSQCNLIKPKDELMSLSKNNILKYRVVFANFPEYPLYEKELKDKKSLSIKEMATCLVAEVK